jgi:hypothetical protein
VEPVLGTTRRSASSKKVRHAIFFFSPPKRLSCGWQTMSMSLNTYHLYSRRRPHCSASAKGVPRGLGVLVQRLNEWWAALIEASWWAALIEASSSSPSSQLPLCHPAAA